jgi:hypothetical protein
LRESVIRGAAEGFRTGKQRVAISKDPEYTRYTR